MVGAISLPFIGFAGHDKTIHFEPLSKEKARKDARKGQKIAMSLSPKF